MRYARKRSRTILCCADKIVILSLIFTSPEIVFYLIMLAETLGNAREHLMGCDTQSFRRAAAGPRCFICGAIARGPPTASESRHAANAMPLAPIRNYRCHFLLVDLYIAILIYFLVEQFIEMLPLIYAHSEHYI